ncbi:MAG TPA: cation diffusion facilitator family transporter [Candidatus Bilamarchaeum sp.]|nr:cation diffusion facilitator family transporter [Candidatus Bilamarchaeum sp.]
MGNKLGAAALSIGVNVALLASKVIVAAMTNSIGMYAEAAHSLFDLMASVLAYLGIRKADEPSDRTHHFGHEKFENLSSLLQAMLIVGTAGVVLFEAYEKLQEPGKVENTELGMALMVVSIPVTYMTARYLSDTAKKEGGSHALEADSAHFATDVAGSVAVLAGLLSVRLGFIAGDALAAFAVGLVMIYISAGLGIKAFMIFMDFSPDAETLARIEGVLKGDRRITRFHKLRARIAGSRIFVDVHIQFQHRTDIVEAHKVAHEIENGIIRAVPQVKEVSIHMEPD